VARKRHSDEDIVKLLREIEVRLASGSDVSTACRAAGISDATYYTWRKKFGGMARSQLSEMKALEKENQRLKKIVADLCGRVNLDAQVITPSGRCSHAGAPIVAQPNANAGILGIRLKVGQTSGEVMRLIKLCHAQYDYSCGSARGFLRSAVMLDDAPAPA
jgi:putative transposase